MTPKKDRIADRRAWYAWRLYKKLRGISIRAVCWPPPEEDWSERVYLGILGAPDEPKRSQESALVWISTGPADPLDSDGLWIARITLPPCCRGRDHSSTVEIDLDMSNPDGTVSTQKRGALLWDVAQRAGKYWVKHAPHTTESGSEQVLAPNRSGAVCQAPQPSVGFAAVPAQLRGVHSLPSGGAG